MVRELARTGVLDGVECYYAEHSPEQTAQFHQQLLERVGRIPGVEVAGGTSNLPMTGGGPDGTFLVVNSADPTCPTSTASSGRT